MNFDRELKIFNHAWSCILPAYLDLCLKNSDIYGPGISVFQMLTEEEQKYSYVTNSPVNQRSNCSFYYYSKSRDPEWEFPDTLTLSKLYNPDNHIFVVLSINIEGELVSDEKLFEKKLGPEGNLVEILA